MNVRTCLGLGIAALWFSVLPAQAGGICELQNARISIGVTQNPQPPDSWSATCSPMGATRAAHSVTTLAFGQTLIAGGFQLSGGLRVPLASAEIFDERTGEFVPTVGMSVARYAHTATRLQSGKVLVVGGEPAAGFPPDGNPAADHTTELYSPVIQQFLPGPALLTPRESGHAATLLADGRVLITGGNVCTPKCGFTDAAEIYDPASGRMASAGHMTQPRIFHTATLLANGRVLIAGGGYSGSSSDAAEIFDPASGRFTALAAKMTAGRDHHAAVRMPNGRVILGGGSSASAEVFNPATGTFRAAQGLLSFTTNEPPAAAVLPNGKVLFVHDFAADIYDPATNALTNGAYAYANSGNFNFPEGGAGALLKDGLFLWTGGLDGNYPPQTSADAFLYRPAD